MSQSVPKGWLISLAVCNSIGFSSATAISLWITVIHLSLPVPIWWGSVVGAVQLAAAAFANVITPYIFRRLSCERLAAYAAMAGLMGNFIVLITTSPVVFVIGCIVAGAGCGILLGCVNILLSRSHSVQGNYAVSQISEVLFSCFFYFFGAKIIHFLGLRFVFGLTTILCLIAAVLMNRISKTVTTPRHSAHIAGHDYNKWAICYAAVAFLLFFIGQSAIWQHLLAIGNLIGIDPQQMGNVLAVSMGGGLVGAVFSRVVGVRFGLIPPLLTTTILLAVALVNVVNMQQVVLFAICTFSIQVMTMATVPYAFSVLAELDPSGRLASRGPALLLLGVSGGPLLSEIILQSSGYRMVGVTAAALVLCATLFFFIADRYAVRSVKKLPVIL